MKLRNIYATLAVAATLVLAGCQEQDFPVPSADGIPVAADYADMISVDVDQTTNMVTFNLNAKGVMPVWIFNGKEYSTRNGLQKLTASAGDYEVEVKILNANGLSDGSVFKTYHVDNTIIDYNKFFTMLAGDGTRQWRVDNEAAGHLACGESGTDGTNWWSAGPNEKADWGVYDNRMMFDAEFNYTFDPGAAGTIYVNKDVTRYDGYTGTEDFNVPAELQTTEYAFDVEGEDMFLVFQKGAYLPYIANDAVYDTPRYKILSISPKKLELVCDEGSIAWHMTWTSEADNTVPPFTGYKYDSEYNLWRTATWAEPTFYYAPGWAPIGDPAYTFEEPVYTLTLPEATSETWQAQMAIATDIPSSSATNYDFSVVFNSTTNHGNITVKLTDTESDGNFLFEEKFSVSAFEDCVFYMSDVAGIDAGALKLVFDFGGNEAGTVITIKNIVLKDHANDDGTILPGNEPEVPVDDVVWNESAPANLWASSTNTFEYYYAPGWAQIADPAMTEADGAYTWTFPEATADQWQNQIKIHTTMATTAAANYDFRLILTPTCDIKGATIKLMLQGDDNTFFFTERMDLTAYEDNVFKMVDFAGQDFPAIDLILDLAGNEAGAQVTLSGVVLQEHQGPVTFDPADPDNLWYNGLDGITWYYAPGWAEVAWPEVKQDGFVHSFTLPEATTDRWQCQMQWGTTIPVVADEVYDFHLVLNVSADMKVMCKLAERGNDGDSFFFADEVEVSAYEDITVDRLGLTGKDMAQLILFLDFGGNPAGCEVQVKDMVFKKH